MVSKEKIMVTFLIVFHFMHFKTLSLYPTRITRRNSENLQKKHRGHHHCCQTTLSREKEGSWSAAVRHVTGQWNCHWSVAVARIGGTWRWNTCSLLSVLGGGVVCPANKDPPRERKGFAVERSRNVNVYASYGKKKFHDSYKKKGELKLVMRSKNAELKPVMRGKTRK